MSLAPRFRGHRLGSANAPHVLEFFWDFTCPYSARSFHRIYSEVYPYCEQAYPGQVQILFRHQVQPWHPQSTMLHEASLAVERVHPDAFFPFAKALFAASEQNFYDLQTYDKSRMEVYRELADLAETIAVPGNPVKSLQVLALLQSASKEGAENAGNAVTTDLKYHLKLARQLSVHVSPTVLIDGILDASVESAWTLDKWKSHLEEKFKDS